MLQELRRIRGPPPPLEPQTPTPPAGPGLFDQMTAGTAPSGSPFASGYDPNAMPTTAAQFTESGDQATADMLNRINTPPAVQNYVPQSRQEGGIIESAGDQELPNQIIELVIDAIRNPDRPEAEEIIETFTEAFGEEAFRELEAAAYGNEPTVGVPEQGMPLERQEGGIIPGNGDAMADNIITTADSGTPNAQDIAISSGEYVVAGDVVSGLGSGNTQRGAAVLDQMQDDVRMDRTGSPQQPPPIDLSDVLPGTYGEQYA
jgi:hypothetical protein